MFGIDDAVAAVSNLAKDVVDRIWPDATVIEKAKLEQAAAMMQQETNLILAQLKINEVEAGSEHWFAACWRPFIGWVCGLSLAYAAILEPMGKFIAQVCFGYTGVFPAVDTSMAMQIMIGMLGIGIGALRSYDKTTGTSPTLYTTKKGGL